MLKKSASLLLLLVIVFMSFFYQALKKWVLQLFRGVVVILLIQREDYMKLN